MHPQAISRVRFGVAAAMALVATSAVAQTSAPTPYPLTVAIPSSQAAPTVRRLSVDDAVTLALEQNLGIQIQRIDPQVQDVGVAQARSFWAPQLSTSLARTSQDLPVNSILSGGQDKVTNSQFTTTVGVNQILPWGGNYALTWNNNRLTTNNIFSNFSPQLQSQASFNYTQPLLRNFKIDQIRQQLALSHKTRDLSDIQLRSVVVQTTRSVKNAYWDLAYAINNLNAQQQSLALAQQSLRDNQKRVDIGTMAPIDIVQAQAEVASNEQNVIVAQASIRQVEDRLRALVFDPAAPDFWNMRLEPTDTAPFLEQAIDVDAAVRNALDRRADLQQARNSLDQSDVNIRYFRNQLMPDVNAQVNYGLTGLGGTQIVRGAGFPGPIIGTVDTSFGSVLGDLLTNRFPQWSAGLQIGYPLGASTSEANLARARLQYQQAQMQLKNLELQIVTQVRDAARQVQTNEQRVRSVRASRDLQERKLEAEEKKFAAGMSTSFFVFQAQRDLAQARTLEIQAISDYNKSLVDFEAVQQVSLTGSSPGVTTAGAGAIQTGNAVIVRSGGQ